METKTTLIADCEANNLYPALTRLWTLQLGDASTDEVTVYADQPGYPSIAEGIERLRAADHYVFHNGLAYDLWAINKFYPGAVERSKLIDTLVLARLLSPEERSHSLRAWGERLAVAKGDYEGDFQRFDDELVHYAIQDIHTTRALYRHLMEQLDGWGESLALEHDVAWAMHLQERHGFGFDVPAAQALDATLRGELADLSAELQKSFPPIAHTSIARATNKKLGIVKGQPRVKWETFEPGSRHHVGRRLQALGWKPSAFGADGAPTVDEKTLADLPWPEAQLLVKFFRRQKMLGQLADGKNGWLKLVKNGRIYGRVNPNGACTGRMTHMSPNTAQVDGDPRMRSLWVPREGWKLVGVDAASLEACMLAHYLARYDGGAYAKIVTEGDEESGTDNHSRNRDVLNKMGLAVNRKGSKNLLYAFIYGSGDFKLASMVVDNLRSNGKPVPKIPKKELGLLVRKGLAKAVPGIDKLSAAVKTAVKERGYLVGLDGRHLLIRSDHSALNTLLQGAGAVVMKKALAIFMHCHGPTMGDLWALCANVHDEVQMEVVPEHADLYGAEMVGAITAAGEYYNLRCPLSGSYKPGSNWSETH